MCCGANISVCTLFVLVRECNGADDLLVLICFRTRAVQKLIETVTTREQIVLITSALQPAFMELVNDPNGNHVIQKCLTNFGADENKVTQQFLFCKLVHGKICSVCTHGFYALVIQKVIGGRFNHVANFQYLRFSSENNESLLYVCSNFHINSS